MKVKKMLVAVVAAALLAVSCALIAGCGDVQKTAAVTGKYVSAEQKIDYTTFLPTYTYKNLTVTTQDLTLYDDNTYCFTVRRASLIGAAGGLNFPDIITSDDKVVTEEGGVKITSYYGPAAVIEDSGIMTVTLSAPIRIAHNQSRGDASSTGTSDYGFIDTENWTERMTAITGKTAADYLSENTIAEATVIVDVSHGTFAQIELQKAA